MTSLILTMLVAFGLPFGAGYCLLLNLFVRYRLPTSLKISFSFGLGTGILTLLMLIIGALKIPFTFATIGLSLVVIIIIQMIFLKSRGLSNQTDVERLLYDPRIIKANNNPCTGFKLLQAFFLVSLLFFIFINIDYVLWRSFTIPIYTWDAYSSIAYKAKVFFFEQRLPHLNLLPHPTYPLLVPFAQTWIALCAGYWDDQIIKIIFPLVFLSYLLIHYKFLVYQTNRIWALFGVAILLSSNIFLINATIAYRDFFLMYYNCLTIILLLLWHRSKVSGFLILASLMAGLSTFTKLEGTSYLLIYYIILLVILFSEKTSDLKTKIRSFLKFFLPSSLICLGFHIFKIIHNVLKEGSGIIAKTQIDFTWDKLDRIEHYARSIAEVLFLSNHWSIVWIVLLLSLLHYSKKRHLIEIRIMFIGIGLFLTLYLLVALFTTNFTWIAGDLKRTTLSRLILHFYPLSVFLIVLLNYSNPADKQSDRHE